MRRITKLGSISLAVVIVAAGLLALDLFGGAEAAPDAPLLYKIDSDFPVTLAAYAQEPVENGPQVHAHVLSTPNGDTLEVRPRGTGQEPLWSESAASGDEPWRIMRLAVARDGTSVAAGTEDGRLLYLTSDQTLYDTFTEFRTGSPITSLTFDSTGEFLSVATFHGDLYLFGRTHHTTQGSFILHVPAPIPAGGLPGASDPMLEDAGTTARDELFPLRGETPFTGRSFVHAALAGHAEGPVATNAQGLYLVASTAYGEVYTYDLGKLNGPGGSLGLRPHVHRLDEGACTKVETPLGTLEVPCSQGALERLLDRLPDGGPEQTETTKNILETLAAQTARELPLDALLSPMPVSQQLPLAGLDVTQGHGHDGQQLVVAAMTDGTVEALQIGPGSDQAPQVQPLWTHSHGRGVRQIALSSLHYDQGSTHALLAVADEDSKIQIHRVFPDHTRLPSAHLETSVAGGTMFLGLSEGDGEQPRSATAGRYLFTGTQDGTIRLYQTRDTGTSQAPVPLWTGTLAVAGPLNAVDLLDTGGVVAAGQGIAVYASLVTVDIDAEPQVDRHKSWKAKAVVDAPDTQVEDVSWRIVHTGPNAVDPVTITGKTLTHTFTREGDYQAILTVKDDRGIEVTAIHDLRVGGKNPVVKMSGPATVTKGAVATFDFVGTHDPNLPDTEEHHGIERIEVHPFGDSRVLEADLETLTLDVTYQVSTGVYRSVATAYDTEGRSSRTFVRIVVTAPGFVLEGDRDAGLNRVQDLAVSPQSGHSVAYGGDGDENGRLILRDGEASLLYEEGTPSRGTDRHVESGAITRDGSLFIGGRTNGEALRLPVDDPDARSTHPVFGEDESVAWTFVSHDGARVLFVSREGRFAAGPASLDDLPHRLSVGREIVHVVADERLIHVVALTANGEALLVDGHRPDRGVRDEHTPQGDVRTMAITPNLDPMGRAWIFFGGHDGQVETWRIVGFDIAVQGRALYDEGLSIHQIAPGRVDDSSRYTLLVTTTQDRPDCPREGRPCGRLHFVDSTGESSGGVPVPERSVELPKEPAVLLSDPLNERSLVASTGTKPTLYAYDRLLDEGPVAEMGGFDARIVAGGMTQDSAGHLIVDHGRHAWTFAPPTAKMRLGPHDGDGEPMWGKRLHSHVNTTLDAGPSGSGHGSIIAAEWDLEEDVLEGTRTVHQWQDHGYKKIRLTVTARVEDPVETLLIDRIETTVPVYPRPPVALLEAAPFNGSAGAVTITSGEDVSFDASSSHHPNGEPIKDYRFHYGTGSFNSGKNPTKTYTYPKPGTFYAYVVVTDEQGSQATSNKIRVDVANRAPQAAFLYSQDGRSEPQGRVSVHVPVSFDASPASDPDGNVVAYEWSFPGGTSSTSKTPDFTFSTTGDQTVRLRVKDDHGAWSPWLDSVFEVDTGIRLKTEQDPPDRSFVSPTTKVTVDAFAHDLRHWPQEGNPQSGATVTVKVYYDGVDPDDPASQPYETATYTTPADGWVEHEVGWSGTLSHNAGRHRVEVQAQIEGEYGETQWSETRVTTFRVEP